MVDPPLTSASRASIERFVRGTLGCRCPDQVFETIAIQRDFASGGASQCTRLVVGDRLLIYIVQDAGVPAVRRLASTGLSERNDCGYNRFRLVVAHECPAQLRLDIEEAFSEAAGLDDRAHLHFIAAETLPDALRAS